MTKYKKTQEQQSINVYARNGRFIETVNRNIYKGFGNAIFIKYKGRYFRVSYTGSLNSEKTVYNIWL